MLFLRNAVTKSYNVSPFIRLRRASAHTQGGRRLSPRTAAQLQQDHISVIDRVNLLEQHKRIQYDLWAISLDLLDLRVPVPIFTKGTTVQQMWASFGHNLTNKISNAMTMHRIAKNHSFPWNQGFKPFSYQIFRTTSTRPNTWLEPLRDIGLNIYKELNAAIARSHTPTINELTKGSYNQRVLERTKMLHKGSSKSLHWTLHSLVSPVQCVSIRALQGHFGVTEPKLGTRWFVQACLKFESLQSLSTRGTSTQPEPKRVLEYLVFEKRMWYDEPWTIRDQLWETIYTEASKEEIKTT